MTRTIARALAHEERTLVGNLRRDLGRQLVIDDPRRKSPFARGYRVGSGRLTAVVQPASLLQLWRGLEVCVRHRAFIIMQAANTSLTGGATPDGLYDRPIILFNTRMLSRIHLIDGGRQVICLAGATLDALEKRLAPIGREPHSVIGSSCIGASVVGGICNNSGGSLVRRGPAYTECALFAQCDRDGELQLIDHLGIALPAPIEDKLNRLDSKAGEFRVAESQGGKASCSGYEARVRDTGACTPSRYNSNPENLFEASGCAGKLAVFAVRLDTFAKDERRRTFYVGTNDPKIFATLRSDSLANHRNLPVAAEYIHRDAFAIARCYGKDMFVAIRCLGAARLPLLDRLQRSADAWLSLIGFPRGSLGRLLVKLARLIPEYLPPRVLDFHERYDHHLLLEMADDGIEEMEPVLEDLCSGGDAMAAFFICSDEESKLAFLHRFVVAGAALRYHSVHQGEISGLVALDVALPRNAEGWFECLGGRKGDIDRKVLYGHFFCHVFHLDCLLGRGADADDVEKELLRSLAAKGAKYPAEHNVGHSYLADPKLSEFYEELDPCNIFNPGIGGADRTLRLPQSEPANFEFYD